MVINGVIADPEYVKQLLYTKTRVQDSIYVNFVIVKGVNIRKKHVKPRKQGEEGGIIPVECAIHSAKVNVVCSKCGKSTRVEYKVENDKYTSDGAYGDFTGLSLSIFDGETDEFDIEIVQANMKNIIRVIKIKLPKELIGKYEHKNSTKTSKEKDQTYEKICSKNSN